MQQRDLRISTGCTVELLRGDGRHFLFRLVPSVEADVTEGKLSVAAPWGSPCWGGGPARSSPTRPRRARCG